MPAEPLTVIRISIIFHRGAEQLALHFPFDAMLKEHIKSFEGVRWTQTHRCFYIPKLPGNLQNFSKHCEGKARIDTSDLSQKSGRSYGPPINTQRRMRKRKQDNAPFPESTRAAIDAFKRDLEQQRYSPATVKTYVSMIKQFYSRTGLGNWRDITHDVVRNYNHSEFIKKKRAYSTHNQFINALKKFCEFHQVIAIDPGSIERPRKQRTLPEVLTREEVATIIGGVRNVKHRTLLSLIYSCGLRPGDALNLKLRDLRPGEGLLYIRQGKGAKDRRVPFSGRIIKMLEHYVRMYRPKHYVFEGQDGGKYSYRSAQQVMKRAVKAAGIERKITLHTLRHSYATHVHQSGTDIGYLSKILGHERLETTMLYTHIAADDIRRVRSPFDDLDI